jgi:predicted transcriptional regulator
MPVSTSFYLPDDFKSRLDELSKSVGKNRTQYIIDAVNAYASGTLPDKAVLDRFDRLSATDASIQKDIAELKTLVIAVLDKLQNPS